MSGYAALVDYSATHPQAPWLEQAGAALTAIAPGETANISAPHFTAVYRPLHSGDSDTAWFKHDRYTVLGDVRLDRRGELIERLQAHFPGLDPTACDAQLLFHAWLLRGASLGDFASGDFSLLIWDSQDQRLHCLRDQFGIKPIYYALLGDRILVSNSINVLRRHHALGTDLDSRAITDFLAFGYNTDQSRTAFAAIAQVPPAHLVSVCRQGHRAQRYWDLTVDPETQYARSSDYIDHLRQELTRAIADRCRTNRVAVAMSGGLDSTSLAALARDHAETTAYTIHGPGEEEELANARLAANSLGFAHVYQYAGPEDIFRGGNAADWPLPEPSRDCYRAPFMSLMQSIAGSHTAGLTGLGADALLAASPDYFSRQFRSGHWGRALRDLARFVRSTRTRPPLYVRASLRERYERSPLKPILPPWLNPEMVRETELQQRFDHMQQEELEKTSPHPRRPEAYRDLRSALWPTLLQRYSSQSTGLPLEFSHPFFDVTLTRLLLAFPPMPWFYRKWVLREAMRDVLPEQVRTRPKSTPAIPGHRDALLQQQDRWLGQLDSMKNLATYIDLQRYNQVMRDVRQLQPAETSLAILPLCLSFWQQQL